MKIHSNIITRQDILNAVPSGCFLATQSDGCTIAQEGSRSHARGYVVRLSGSSPYTMDTRNLAWSEKSATYEEWGFFISKLFSIDPSAKIGRYKNAEDFEAQTEHQFPVRPLQGV